MKMNVEPGRGQSLVELLVAVAVASTFLPAILTGIVASREGKIQQSERLSAIAFAKEAEAAIASVAERGWAEVEVNGTYHPAIVGSSWRLLANSEPIGEFTRSITISDAQRNAGVLVQSGGSVDPSTKKVVVTVSWSVLFPTAVTSTRYITRHTNRVYTETTQAQFNAGTKTNVTVTNTSGGEVILAAGGSADWCEPNLSITATDLPKQGVANAVSAIEGRVFAGTGDNSSGISFANVTIGNTNPPIATVAGTFDGYKTNDVFGETNYAYLGTDTNSKEIEIINVTTQPYSEAGYFNAPGNGNGSSVFVVGSTGYMTSGSKLYSFNLSSKTGSRPIFDPDGVTLSAEGKSIVVVGSYAYVAIDSSSIQLEIIDVSDPNNLRVVGEGAVGGGEGKDIVVNDSGTRAYLVTETSPTKPEFFIIDVSTKTGSRPTVGSYDTNGMDPKGVTVVSGNRAIVVGSGGEEYQAVNITSEAAPTRCGGLQINNGINGLSSVREADGDSFSYIITGDTTSELKIIAGGPGGILATNGTFESATFDASASAAFNRFDVTTTNPSQTNLTYQVAGADPVNNSCSGVAFTFVGPDGTGSTQFATGSAIPFSDDSAGYENPARCFRYKAFLSTTDSTQTPVFSEITISYSP